MGEEKIVSLFFFLELRARSQVRSLNFVITYGPVDSITSVLGLNLNPGVNLNYQSSEKKGSHRFDRSSTLRILYIYSVFLLTFSYFILIQLIMIFIYFYSLFTVNSIYFKYFK